MTIPPSIFPFAACAVAALTGYGIGSATKTAARNSGEQVPLPATDRPVTALQGEWHFDKNLPIAESAARFGNIEIEKLTARAHEIAKQDDRSLDKSDRLLLEIFTERDPTAALALAKSPDCSSAVLDLLLSELVAHAAMEGIGAVERLVSNFEDPSSIVNYLSAWAPHLGQATVLPFVFEHSKDTHNGEFSRVGRLFTSWAAGDLTAALAAALSAPKGAKRNAALAGAISGWAGKDPKAAWAWIHEQGLSWLVTNGRNIVARRARETNHPDAETFASQAKPIGRYHYGSRAQFITNDAIADGPAAFADTLRGVAGDSKRLAIIGRMALKDPAAALALITDLPQGKPRAKLISKLFQHQYDSNGVEIPQDQRLPKAMEMLDLLEDPADRRAALAHIVDDDRIFGHERRIDKAKFLAGLENPDWFASEFKSVVHSWGLDDLDAALEWAGSLPDGAAREAAMNGLLPGMSVNAPDLAIEMVGRIDDAQQRNAQLEQIGNWRGSRDRENVIAWVNTLDAEIGNPIMAGALANMARNNHVAEAAAGFDGWMSNSPELSNSEHAAGTAANIVSEWARTSPESAAGWIGTIPDGTAQARAAGALAERWISRDPVEASGWIAELPEGMVRDAATSQLVSAVHLDDPASALQWAASIGDLEERLDSTEKTIRFWSRFDLDSAWEAAANAGLSAEEIEAVAGRLH